MIEGLGISNLLWGTVGIDDVEVENDNDAELFFSYMFLVDSRGFDLRSALQHLGVVCLQAHDTSALEAALMHYMVRLCSQHALDIILHVAEDNSVSLGGLIRRFGIEGLDLEDLEDRDGEPGSRAVGIVEDGPGWENVSFSFIMMVVSQRRRVKTHSKAPGVKACSAIIAMFCVAVGFVLLGENK